MTEEKDPIWVPIVGFPIVLVLYTVAIPFALLAFAWLVRLFMFVVNNLPWPS